MGKKFNEMIDKKLTVTEEFEDNTLLARVDNQKTPDYAV